MKRTARRLQSDQPMRDYATRQAADLLRRTIFQANRASSAKDADPIHDLRVSIRRLTQCLRAFQQFFPKGSTKKVRQRLKVTMDLASQARNRDVALELLRGVPAGRESPLVAVLKAERSEAEQALAAELKAWSRRSLHRKWSSRLGL